MARNAVSCSPREFYSDGQLFRATCTNSPKFKIVELDLASHLAHIYFSSSSTVLSKKKAPTAAYLALHRPRTLEDFAKTRGESLGPLRPPPGAPALGASGRSGFGDPIGIHQAADRGSG